MARLRHGVHLPCAPRSGWFANRERRSSRFDTPMEVWTCAPRQEQKPQCVPPAEVHRRAPNTRANLPEPATPIPHLHGRAHARP